MNVPDDDDLARMLDGVSDAPEPPKPARKPLVAVNDEDDAATFLSSTGLKAEREVPDITKPWMRHHEFVRVQTPEEVEAIVEEALACGRCSLDLETEGLDNRIRYDSEGTPRTVHQIVGFCIAVGAAKKGYYIPVRHAPTDGGPDLNVKPLERVEAAITRLCREAQPTPAEGETDPLGFRHFTTPPRVTLDFWNAKFDQEFLYPVTGIDYWHPDSFEDGLLAHFTLYSGDKRLGLKGKAEEVLRSPDGDPYEMIELKELFPNKRKILFPSLSPDEPGVVKYAGSDAICTRLLCDRPDLLPVINADPGKKFTYRLEKQVSQVVRVMERNRAKINRNKLTELRDRHRQVREEYRDKIIRLAASKGFENFEPGSPKQLSDFLFGERGLNINPKPPMNEKSGQYKTDYDTLDLLGKELGENAPEVLKWVISYREEDKVLGTYLESLSTNADANDELRFQFKQTGAATGRFSAPAGDNDQGFSGIPIHGIPSTSDIRQCFVARDGYTMVKCDYAGQELRIVTNLSNEPVWTKEFLEGDGDLHSITARAFFNKPEVTKDERAKGKCVHPDTLVVRDGRLTSLSVVGFPDEPDTFRGVEGHVIWDGLENKPLTATYNGGVKALVHVVTGAGIVTCTPQHRFKMRDGSFVAAGDLKEGDTLEPSSHPTLTDSPYPDLCLSLWEGIPTSRYDLSHDWAYFAGAYAGDGTGNDSSACLTHGEAEKIDAYGNPYEDWIRTLEDAATRCGLTTTRKDENQLYLGSRVVVRLFTGLGLQRKHGKALRIPTWVLEAGRTSFLHYFAGLLDTDGTVGLDSPTLDWTTKDMVLAGQVAASLRAFGLDFQTELTFNQTYERHYVRLRLTVASSWEMRSYLRHEGKKARLREPKYAGRVADRYVVKAVLPADDGPCVDLTVEPTHVYWANGHTTHNTANFALVYGGGPAAIMRATGCDKLEGQRRKQAFDKAVPTFANWVKSQHEKVKRALGVYTAFGRWVAIPDANCKKGEKDSNGRLLFDDDAVKALRAACERHATNYPIQGSGADIMKIAMVLLHKEFYRRGWLRHQTDAVRMLLSVHDELVFEVRHDLVFEAIPVLTEEMEKPTLLARHPYSPKWKVPLVTEPLLGDSWGAEYGCHRVKSDEKLKEGGFIASGYVYGKIPASLQPFIPAEGGAPQRPELTRAAPVAAPLPTTEPSAPQTPPVQLGAVAEKAVATVRLNTTTVQSIAQVRMYVGRWMVRKGGHILRLTDKFGVVLIDPNLRIRVNAQKFAQCLLEANLSDGKVGEESLS